MDNISTNIGLNPRPPIEQGLEPIKKLQQGADLFAWQPPNMLEIDPDFLCHRLPICVEARAVAQKKRKISSNKRVAMECKMTKLKEVGFIREVKYTTWLSNVDCYPLPSIDWLVDRASKFQILNFLDAYSGYNQIRMYPPDEEKIAFMTEEPNYYY
ncbi:hypothetical protein CR513_38835, partial [Mucuna pruriens]